MSRRSANGHDSVATAHAAALPDYLGSHKRTCRTVALAHVLRWHAAARAAAGDDAGAATLLRASMRLLSCGAVQRTGESIVKAPRCGHPVCPRCEGRKGAGFRKRMERRVAALTDRTALLTLTSPADAPTASLSALLRAFKALRRHALWRTAFVGGEVHLDVARARDGGPRGWNVHAHGIVTLRHPDPSGVVNALGATLGERWTRLLAPAGLVGSIDLQRIGDLAPDGRPTWAEHTDQFGESTTIHRPSFYVTSRVPDVEVAKLRDPQDVATFVRFLEGGRSGLRRVVRFGNWRAPRAARVR